MWLMTLQENNRQVFEWTMLGNNTINFTIWGISSITKMNSNMHLLDCCSPSIIFSIVTSICKCYVVKFIVFQVFSCLNYFLWLVTHLLVRAIYLNLGSS